MIETHETMKEALRESEERFSRLVEATFEGIAMTDQGRIIDANQQFAQMLGYDFSEMIGLSVMDVIAPESHELVRNNVTSDCEGPYEHLALRKDGSTLPVEVRAKSLPYKGRVVRVTAIRDITQRKQAEQEISRHNRELALLQEQYHQAQKMEAVGRLTAGVAHDFNNLLTAINGFARLIQAELRPDDPIQEMVGTILHSGQRAADLVRQLLAFSRKQIIQPQVLDLNIGVAEMDKMLRRIIGEDINLKTVLSPELWPVKVDPTQIEQVIINLAVNARDAMPIGGQLTLETANVVIDENYVAGHLGTQPGRYVLLAISDTGCGMSHEVKTRIFEPFFTTKALSRGTGLGLATVFGIVKQSGGDIWVYSEENVGTTFKIYLPCAEEKTLTPPVRPEIRPEMPVGNETILLVEDDSGVRELLRQVLSRLGYTLLEARNGQEALRLIADYADPIHLLLTDVIMPGISGKALAEALAHIRPDLKRLFMSGYTDEAIVQHGVLDSGMAFLQKPFSPMTLAAKVRSSLDS